MDYPGLRDKTVQFILEYCFVRPYYGDIKFGDEGVVISKEEYDEIERISKDNNASVGLKLLILLVDTSKDTPNKNIA